MLRTLPAALLVWTVLSTESYAQTVTTESSAPLPRQSSTLRIEPKATETRRFKGSWQGDIGVEGADHGKDQGFASYFGARVQFDYRLSPMLNVRATPGAVFYTSRLQQRIETDDYKSTVYVDDSFLQFTPIKEFELRAGALSQRFLDMPLLVSRGRAFPGLMQLGHFDFGSDVHLDIVAQQVVPTSRSLNTERNTREALPMFQTQSAHLNVKPVPDVTLGFWGGHYQWTNLPNKVAADSQLLGNTRTGELWAATKFAYGFDGYFGGARGCFCPPVGLGGEVSLMRFTNTSAPAGRRNGQMFEVSPMWRARDWDLRLTGALFFNERDTTPATYNPARYGNNNRNGYSAEVKLHLKSYGFSVVGQYVDAGTINRDPNQQRLTSMLLGVETDYEAF